MTAPKEEIPIIPISRIAVVEDRDQITLAPLYWRREFVAFGRVKADTVKPKTTPFYSQMWDEVIGHGEVWVILRWERDEYGEETTTFQITLDKDATEAEAREKYGDFLRFCDLTKQELEDMIPCFIEPAKADHIAYIRKRFPDSRPTDPKSIEQSDLYQARLKVLAGMTPETAHLLGQVYETDDPAQRQKLEREAVQAYFAELAHYWSEDQVLEWQRTNPVGTEWLCEFGRVFAEPRRELDPINHEIVLNWLRKGYNLLTEQELSNAVLIMTGQRLMPGALKKRRERLGLTTQRPTGPRPNSEQ